MGRTREDAGSVDLPPRPPETKEVIESKLIPCERCGTVVAMLIFAPNATDPGHFENYARKMYPHYNHLNVTDLDHWPCIRRRATHRPPSRCAESVADAGADPTVAICAIQFAPGPLSKAATDGLIRQQGSEQRAFYNSRPS